MTQVSFSSTPVLSLHLKKISQDTAPAAPTALIRQALDDEGVLFTALCRDLDKNLYLLDQLLVGVTQVVVILEELGGITVQARHILSPSLFDEEMTEAATDHTPLKELEARFRRTLIKLDKFVMDEVKVTPNLLLGESLSTSFVAQDRHPLVTQGADLRASSLGFRTADFSDLMSIQNARIDVMNAMDMAVTIRNIISADIALITVRRSFAEQALAASCQDVSFVTDNFILDTGAYHSLFSIPLFMDAEEEKSCAPHTSIIAQFAVPSGTITDSGDI
ncbi:MAG: hypothetical protein WC043_06995 [Pseudobdellovibrionaceae bacterium]